MRPPPARFLERDNLNFNVSRVPYRLPHPVPVRAVPKATGLRRFLVVMVSADSLPEIPLLLLPRISIPLTGAREANHIRFHSFPLLFFSELSGSFPNPSESEGLGKESASGRHLAVVNDNVTNLVYFYLVDVIFLIELIFDLDSRFFCLLNGRLAGITYSNNSQPVRVGMICATGDHKHFHTSSLLLFFSGPRRIGGIIPMHHRSNVFAQEPAFRRQLGGFKPATVEPDGFLSGIEAFHPVRRKFLVVPRGPAAVGELRHPPVDVALGDNVLRGIHQLAPTIKSKDSRESFLCHSIILL